jgi:hypothetical protein
VLENHKGKSLNKAAIKLQSKYFKKNSPIPKKEIMADV